MRKFFSFLVAALTASSVSLAQDDDAAEAVETLTPIQILNGAGEELWRPMDPENTLYMYLPAGLVIIELRPDFAPLHVEQIKALVRDEFYDGLNFHRVIEGFMAQGGDPKGDGTGGSDRPNIPGEFSRDTSKVQNHTIIGRDRAAARVGFAEGMPFAAEPEGLRSFRSDQSVQTWPLHCPGVMSMARASDPGSANSQFFLMIGDSRQNLDRRYSGWGWIVDGFEATRRITRGEPPSRPTPIIRMRIEADLPEKDRRNVEIFRTSSETFTRYLKATREIDDTGFVKDICNINVPTRVDGKIER